MKQPNYYTQALAYLRDYCLRHGRPMHFSAGDIFETEGAAARLFGYIEGGGTDWPRLHGLLLRTSQITHQ